MKCLDLHPLGHHALKVTCPARKSTAAGLPRKTFFEPLVIEGSFGCRVAKVIKMESFRKLSNFNFQWTKTMYQNNKARAIDVIISYL